MFANVRRFCVQAVGIGVGIGVAYKGIETGGRPLLDAIVPRPKPQSKPKSSTLAAPPRSFEQIWKDWWNHLFSSSAANGMEPPKREDVIESAAAKTVKPAFGVYVQAALGQPMPPSSVIRETALSIDLWRLVKSARTTADTHEHTAKESAKWVQRAKVLERVSLFGAVWVTVTALSSWRPPQLSFVRGAIFSSAARYRLGLVGCGTGSAILHRWNSVDEERYRFMAREWRKLDMRSRKLFNELLEDHPAWHNSHKLLSRLDELYKMKFRLDRLDNGATREEHFKIFSTRDQAWRKRMEFYRDKAIAGQNVQLTAEDKEGTEGEPDAEIDTVAPAVAAATITSTNKEPEDVRRRKVYLELIDPASGYAPLTKMVEEAMIEYRSYLNHSEAGGVNKRNYDRLGAWAAVLSLLPEFETAVTAGAGTTVAGSASGSVAGTTAARVVGSAMLGDSLLAGVTAGGLTYAAVASSAATTVPVVKTAGSIAATAAAVSALIPRAWPNTTLWKALVFGWTAACMCGAMYCTFNSLKSESQERDHCAGGQGWLAHFTRCSTFRNQLLFEYEHASLSEDDVRRKMKVLTESRDLLFAETENENLPPADRVQRHLTYGKLEAEKAAEKEKVANGEKSDNLYLEFDRLLTQVKKKGGGGTPSLPLSQTSPATSQSPSPPALSPPPPPPLHATASTAPARKS